MQTQLRIALPKGDQAVSQLFRQAGYPIPLDLEESRKYIVALPCENLSFILAKAIDIPTYVAYRAADVGIAGKEVLKENSRDVYKLLDLGITESSVSTRLIANRASFMLRGDEIRLLCDRLSAVTHSTSAP